MKLSQWNSYIDLENYSGLIYNALSDSFIVIRHMPDYNKILRGEIENLSDTVIATLIKHGVVVSKELNEVDQLREKIRLIDNDNTVFNLHVNPTLDCNFKCWYCYENHVEDSYMSEEIVNNIINLVKNQIITNSSLRLVDLYFFGGEPLLYFNDVVKKLISSINDVCKNNNVYLKIHFTTNGFLINGNIISFLSRYDVSFQITLDGGKANHDRTRFGKGGSPSFEAIWDNIIKLALSKFRVLVRINYTTSNIASTEEIVEILRGFPKEIKDLLTIDYQRVWQDKLSNECDSTYEKAKEIRNSIRNMGYMVSNNRILDGVNNSCYGDKRNQLLVNYNGDIFCCTARSFESTKRLGILSKDGVILWDKDRYEKRMNSKFIKPICHVCRIAPLCGGGCRTQAIEHYDEKECIYKYSKQDIDDFIIERFEERYMNVL